VLGSRCFTCLGGLTVSAKRLNPNVRYFSRDSKAGPLVYELESGSTLE
jgi:hypothetical protein